MSEYNRKKNISRYFIFLLMACLIFTSLGYTIENTFAVDVNESIESVGGEITLEDKLGNSHVDNDSLRLLGSDEEVDLCSLQFYSNDSSNNSYKLESSENEILGKTYTLSDGTFADIQALIKSANSGDTIKLSGTFKASNANSKIKISKKLTITSDSVAVLDGVKKSGIMHIYDGGKGTIISNLKFINAEGKRGAALRISTRDVTVENCIFQNNHGTVAGALGSDLDSDVPQNLIIRKCTFIKNCAYGDGSENSSAAGAVGVYGYNSKVIDCVFDSNWVKSKECYGGALQIGMDHVDSRCTVSGCVFKNNYVIATKSMSHGGAGCVRDGVSYLKCTFINNTADQGGALTMHASGSIVDCKFINNTASRLYGGAISSGFLFDTMVLKISNCDFEGNTAPEGGAIQAIGLNVAILNSNFKNNHVTKSGGAITVQAVNVSVSQSNFTSNYAEVNGGAICIKGNDTVIKDSIFNYNNAIPHANKLNDGLGGAIYINSPKASIMNNEFNYNTARNGSAIYYEKTGERLNLVNNKLFENQAWVYQLPIHVEDIYYEDTENVGVIIYGGNNIANYENLAISNAIYNAAKYDEIMVDGENPLYGATMTGELYQDSREYNIAILLNIKHEDGSIVYENTLNSSYLGEVNINLNDLKPGKYYVTATHFEDTYYKEIVNTTSFMVYPKVDNQITITTNPTNYNFEDVVVWTINITNNGPNNATEVIVNNLLPEGLIYFIDNSGGLYNKTTGILNVSTLDVGEKLSFNIVTIINKTGEILNTANITSIEFDTDMSNNFDEQLINVNPASDLSVTKTVNNSNPNYKDIVNWTIIIRNNGPDVAHNITIHDVIPSTLILLNSTSGYDSKRGIWEVESLEVGEERIFNIITQVLATGVIENSANAYGIEYDYDLSNNHDEEVIMVDPASDLSITKTVNASEVNYLDYVKWTLTITNNGPDNATGVKIVDILPEGFTYVNSTHDYSDSDEIYIGNLAIGQTIAIEIVTLVENTGNFTNYANITGNEYDYDLDNNYDNESIFVYPASDLEIEKTVDELEPKYGEGIYWTITVRNNGPDTAHDVVVCDIFSNELKYVSDDSDGDYNPQTGIWNIGTLEVGEEVSLEIYTIVNKTGRVTNNANVTACEYDYDLENNHDNETIEVEPSADLSIIKTVNNTSPNYQDVVKWRIVVVNNGPDDATNVEITERIPEGLILLNQTVTKGEYDDGLWSIDIVKKDETQTLELICRVNKTGNMTNVVVVSADEYDPNSTNNEANETIEVPPAVDIEVIQDVNNSNPYFGEEIIWMLTVKNNGPNNGTNVSLVDILPNSLIFVSYNATKGEYIDGIWDIGSLEIGGIEYLNITCIANEPGIIINDAQATSYEYDWNLSNNYDNALITVLPVTDLSVEKYVNNSTPNYLDIVTWTIKVINNGPNDASNVEVLDSLPKGLHFIKSSDDDNYNNGRWYIGELKNGEVKQLDIKCRIISTGFIKNTASVTGDNFDPDLDNNYAEESISVKPASDLIVTKITSKKHYVVGDMVKYIITVVNNGPDGAYNVKVRDILDKSLVLKSFKTSKGQFDKSSKTWKIDFLENGESAVLILNVIATADGIVKNRVVVTSDSFDYNMTNNNDSCFINVSKKPSLHNKTIPPKKFNPQKPVLHQTGNPFAILIFSFIILGGNVLRKII